MTDMLEFREERGISEGGADRLGGFPHDIVQVSRAIVDRSMQLHGNEARRLRYDLGTP